MECEYLEINVLDTADPSSRSAYLHFWNSILMCRKLRPPEELALFGSELVLDYFQFTELHAAVLGLNLDGATPQDVITRTPREAINDQDSIGRTALAWACVQSDMQKIEKLLKMGADPNISDSDGRTSLHHLASWTRHPNERCLEELLQNGAKPDARNMMGGTPLHDFTFNEFCTALSIEKFHRAGADLDIRDHDGWTPVHWAVRHCHIDVIETLARCGANLEIQSSLGTTPLTYALVRHQYQAFRYLLERGCNYAVRTQSGTSLLHFAARDADINTLQYLQQKNLEGLNPNDRDEDGWTALELAERRRDGIYEWADLVRTQVLPDADPQLWFEAFVTLNQKLQAK